MSKLDMALVGVDDLSDPRLLEVDRSTRLVHFEAMAWASRYRTDGLISRAALRRLTDASDPEAAADALVAAGVWTVDAYGWRMGWDGQIRSADAAQIETRNRERWARQKAHQREDHRKCSARWCSRRAAHVQDDHSDCHPRWCPHADTSADTGADNTPDTPAAPPPIESVLIGSNRPASKTQRTNRTKAANAAGLASVVPPAPSARTADEILADPDASADAKEGARAWIAMRAKRPRGGSLRVDREQTRALDFG